MRIPWVRFPSQSRRSFRYSIDGVITCSSCLTACALPFACADDLVYILTSPTSRNKDVCSRQTEHLAPSTKATPVRRRLWTLPLRTMGLWRDDVKLRVRLPPLFPPRHRATVRRSCADHPPPARTVRSPVCRAERPCLNLPMRALGAGSWHWWDTVSGLMTWQLRSHSVRQRARGSQRWAVPSGHVDPI